jgi:nicotinamidase-related amidase
VKIDMKSPSSMHCTVFAMAMLATVATGTSSARSGDIVAEWAIAKTPPVPELRPVTLDRKTTALFVLDMMKGNCATRPRCLATVPNVKKLLDASRAAGLAVFHTFVLSKNPADVVDPGIAPREGEWVAFQRGPDKFLGNDLERRLRDLVITSVIVTGTTAQGAVLGAASGVAQRGWTAIVPVDGISAEDHFNEQYAAWHLYKGGPAFITEKITLTRSDLIKF